MCGIKESLTAIFVVSVEVGYVLRHPRRAYSSALHNRRRRQALNDVDRSAAKQRHPVVLKKPAAVREEIARRDAERIVRNWPELTSPPNEQSQPPRGRK